MKMVRMGDWKLTFDMMGSGVLYHLPSDPLELKNRYNDPAAAPDRMRLMAELLAWNIRTQDNLPTAAYQAKWARHNWYAPYRRGQE
jgi:arylsulfatase A-like enzyme